jgi:cysteinyl-tRNA synthetase
MSKSLGNFSTIKKVLDNYEANTIRYFLLSHHYRSPVDFNDEALLGAKNRIDKIHRGLAKAINLLGITSIQELERKVIEFQEPPNRLVSDRIKFLSRLEVDLDTPGTLSTMDNCFKVMGQKLDEDDQQSFEDYFFWTLRIFYFLGFDLKILFERELELPKDEIRTIYKEMTGEWLAEDQAPEDCLKTIVSMRKRAKEIKNWTQADAIRKHLTDIGLQLLDNKDGTTSVEKDGLEIVRV